MAIVTLNINMQIDRTEVYQYIQSIVGGTIFEASAIYNDAVASEMDFFVYFDQVLSEAGLTAEEIKAQHTGILNLWANFHGIMPTP